MFHLPLFIKEDPELWFLQIETIFTLAEIQSDEQKYQIIVSNIDHNFLAIITDISCEYDHGKRYDSLKDKIISKFLDLGNAEFGKLFRGKSPQ